MTCLHRPSLLMGVITASLLVAGCAETDASKPEDPFASNATASRVQVDTPELRALKQRAEIEPCPASDAGTPPIENGLPEVTLPCLGGGQPVHLHGLRGKPLVINVWAYWCGPCRRELPVLQEFYERAKGEVRMLGVDFEDPQPGQALELLRESGVTYPQVADFDKAIDAGLGRHPVPMTVLVDADGVVVQKLPVEIESADQLAAAAEESLGVDL